MDGNITRQFTVWCGTCIEWYQESCHTQAQAVKAFKRLGWKKTQTHGWVCPDCLLKSKGGA